MLDRIHVTIVDQAGKDHIFEVAEGDNLLDIAQANDLDMEGKSGLHYQIRQFFLTVPSLQERVEDLVRAQHVMLSLKIPKNTTSSETHRTMRRICWD